MNRSYVLLLILLCSTVCYSGQTSYGDYTYWVVHDEFDDTTECYLTTDSKSGLSSEMRIDSELVTMHGGASGQWEFAMYPTVSISFANVELVGEIKEVMKFDILGDVEQVMVRRVYLQYRVDGSDVGVIAGEVSTNNNTAQASLRVNPEFIDMCKAGDVLKVRIHDYATEQTYDTVFSLSGFTKVFSEFSSGADFWKINVLGAGE